MTQAQAQTHGLGIPSAGQLLLAAMLCVLVELVLNAVRKLRMDVVRPDRGECHARAPHAVLPATGDSITQEEQNSAAGSSASCAESITRIPGAGRRLVSERQHAFRLRDISCATRTLRVLTGPWPAPAMRWKGMRQNSESMRTRHKR